MKKTKLYSVLFNKCPKCHEGDMFEDPNPYHLSKMDKMPERCPVCGQKYELEPMFFYGAMYAGYAITVALSVASFLATYTFFDLPLGWYIAINAAFLVAVFPLTFRWARSLWINFFVHYDPEAAKG